MTPEEMVVLSDKVQRLEWLLLHLRRGKCWCEAGLGNPMMQGRHSFVCEAAREYFGQTA